MIGLLRHFFCISNTAFYFYRVFYYVYCTRELGSKNKTADFTKEFSRMETRGLTGSDFLPYSAEKPEKGTWFNINLYIKERSTHTGCWDFLIDQLILCMTYGYRNSFQSISVFRRLKKLHGIIWMHLSMTCIPSHVKFRRNRFRSNNITKQKLNKKAMKRLSSLSLFYFKWHS